MSAASGLFHFAKVTGARVTDMLGLTDANPHPVEDDADPDEDRRR